MSDQEALRSTTAAIVAAYVESNAVPAADLPSLILAVHRTLSGLGGADQGSDPVVEAQKPAVSIRRSVSDDHLICLEEGRQFKSLRRHLLADHGLTPDEYRRKWGLPADYPMVAPSYAKVRSEMAKKIGLGSMGRKPRGKPAPKRK